jgi:Tol biopolymer transport system component
LTRIGFGVTPVLRHFPSVGSPFLSWSLDAKWLLTVERTGSNQQYQITRISVDTGDKRSVTSARSSEAAFAGDDRLALSPDGRLLAFTRNNGITVRDIYVVPMLQDMLAAREPEQLTHDGKNITGLAWAADGRNLVFSSTRGGKLELWQLAPHHGHKPVKLRAGGDDPQDLAISRQGNRLVYTREFGDVNIWRIGLTDREAGKTQNLISSTRSEGQPSYSPDGRQIAFESDRSGDENIWIANADGVNPRQVTFYTNAWAGSPRWSPDGQKIAFDCNVAGNWDIYVVSSQGGKPVQLTHSPESEYRPSWSRDGKWIYYSSTLNHIRKIPANGGKDIQVTQNGFGMALESPDGQTLYFPGPGGLWMKPLAGGEETRISDSLYSLSFNPAKYGVYMVDRRDLQLKLLDPRGRLLKTITSVPNPASIGMSISPDERWMVYPKIDHGGSELMLVENFR